MTKSYLFTKEGFRALEEELDKLIKRRPQVVVNLTNAREQGDLSENAGYHAAKEELGQIDSRVKEIKYLLRVGKVVKSTNGQIVSFGSKVTLESNGESQQFQIVEELEADPLKGKISTNSAVCSTVIGKKVGDSVNVETPAGKTIYKIVELIP